MGTIVLPISPARHRRAPPRYPTQTVPIRNLPRIRALLLPRQSRQNQPGIPPVTLPLHVSPAAIIDLERE